MILNLPGADYYDSVADSIGCYRLAIGELRKAHVAAQGDYWQTLGELYAWESGPLFGGHARDRTGRYAG